MIKAHLQLIYKSRLTQIIIGVLIIAFLIFVGVHIYGWLSFNGSTVSFEIDGKTYFQDKCFAQDILLKAFSSRFHFD